MPLEEQEPLDELIQKIRGIPSQAPNANPLAQQPKNVFGVTGEDVSPNLFPAEFHDAYRQAQFLKDNSQPGVPLDVESGAPFSQRFKASFRRDPEQVVKYWQDEYGANNVRLTKDGDLIVRTTDKQTKQPKDLLVNEKDVTLKDVADLAGSAPAVAATIASIYFAKKIPGIGQARGIGGAGRDILAGAGGTFLGNTTRDVLARAADSMQPIDSLPHVLGENASEIPLNIVADTALAGGGKLLGKIISPFNKVGPQQEDAREAVTWLKDNLGIDYPMSAGEKTGSPLLQRLEAFQERLPGESGRYKAIREEQRTALNQAANVAQGLPQTATVEQREATVPTMDTLIQRVRHAVQKQLEPMEQRVSNAREKLVTDANNEILNEISAATMPQRQLDRGIVGDAIRGKVEAIRKDFTDTAAQLYDAVRKLPGGSDRILATPNLSTQARNYLEKEIAGADITQTVPTGLYGSTGAPLMRQQTTRETAKDFVPSDILGRLQELARLGVGKFSLQDLIAMRNDVSNAIAVGESIPGVQTHHLKNISKMLTDAMDDAVSSISDPRLKQAWQKANTYYKANVEKFHSRLISSVLKPAEAPGHVGSEEIVKRLMEGPDKITEIRDFLGANSPEYNMLKRSVADYIFERNFDIGKQVVKAKDFLSDMRNLAVEKPTVFNEVFGSRARRIFSIASEAIVGQSDKLDAAMIEQGIRNPARFPNLLELVKAERLRDKTYKNEILKSIGSKSFPGDSFNASEFVSRFIRSSSPAEIKPVMEAIKDEGLLWQVRAKTVEDLLNEVSRHPTASDRVAFRLDPRRTINTVKLQEILEAPERRKVLETILGEDKVQLLERMGRVIKPGEVKHGSFQTAASLSAGAQISALERGGIIHFIGGAMENALSSFLLSAPVVRQWAGNTVMTPTRQHALVMGLIGSEPFMRSLVEDYGVKGAKQAVSQAEQRGNYWLQQHYSPQAQRLPGTNDANALRLLKQLAQ